MQTKKNTEEKCINYYFDNNNNNNKIIASQLDESNESDWFDDETTIPKIVTLNPHSKIKVKFNDETLEKKYIF